MGWPIILAASPPEATLLAASLVSYRAILVLAIVLAAAPALHAQIEYYDLETGRPLRVQDAYAIERYGWELQVGPGVSALDAGATTWGVETALEWGALPRTQIEIVAPFVGSSGGAGGSGLAGLALGALYNFNAETLGLPAFALAATVTSTAGAKAPSHALLALEGIATRGFPGFRVHVNAAATIGPIDSAPTVVDRSRWSAAAAVDHSWPVSSLLAAAELVATQPMSVGSAVGWGAGAGVRWQAAPQLVLDASLSRRFAGSEIGWTATAGISWSFAVRAFMPVSR